MSSRAISARERRTVLIGAAVSAAALAFAYGALPFLRHWREREQVIAAETDRLARLRGLVAHEHQLGQAAIQRNVMLESGSHRLLTGRTAALAAASLQGLLQSYAEQSQVTVSRLDVAGEGNAEVIPASISAVGDIYGLTNLLSLVQHGSLLIELAELSIRPNPALHGELLNITLSLRAPWIEN